MKNILKVKLEYLKEKRENLIALKREFQSFYKEERRLPILIYRKKRKGE